MNVKTKGYPPDLHVGNTGVVIKENMFIYRWDVLYSLNTNKMEWSLILNNVKKTHLSFTGSLFSFH